MKSPLLYLIEVLFCSGLFLVFYRLFLVRRVAFTLCCRYLVLTTLLAMLIPALNLPLYPAQTVYYNLPILVSESQVVPNTEAVTTGAESMPVDAATPIDWSGLLHVATGGLYGLALLISIWLFAHRIGSIRRLRRASTLTHYKEYTLAEHPSVSNPFAFLHTVFIGGGYTDKERCQVICHEVGHVRHHHSVDRMVMEIVRCIFWFNPFVWIAERQLIEVQEWQADRDVLDAGYDLTSYRKIIFRQLFGYSPDITCGLNQSITKNRFIMMTQFKKSKFTLVRLGAVVPVVVGMMLLCSFTAKTPEPSVFAQGQHTPDLFSITPSESPSGSIIRISGENIYLNDKQMTLDELGRILKEERVTSDPTYTVTILADDHVQMGLVADLKQELRKANILRVCYLADDGSGVKRLFPPVTKAGEVVIVVPDKVSEESPKGEVRKKTRNVFLTLISGNNQIMGGPVGRQELLHVSQLKDKVKEFVLNPSNDLKLSEKKNQTLELPDGSTWIYPESQGIVSLQTARNTNYKTYISVQNELNKAFEEIREQVALSKFHCSFADLTPAQQQMVMRAVPLEIAEAESRK